MRRDEKFVQWRAMRRFQVCTGGESGGHGGSAC